ncbi:hypothetical protein J2T56_001374 [Natronobacillus azotifigens]|uniref:Uncharacterized protein n=1 Tax=Natronobacillus azotifigens TaxID=472978 RepID=A0A9J6RBJ3_9BACI|nr:hypothetical protein [Natronobacillus azotifigens]MCZ0703058.1 hypothetical protein [Natronobacillus azotifigens]
MSSTITIRHVRIEEPVFFDHYYDLSFISDSDSYQDIPFELGYITNANDSRTVVEVSFPEHPDLYGMASEYNMHGFGWGYEEREQHGDIFGQYSVRTVYLQMRMYDIEEDRTITKAELYFSDGSNMVVDIGQINLYKHEHSPNLLKHMSGSASSAGTSESRYNVLEEISILKIEGPLYEKFDHRIEIEMNGVDSDTLHDMGGLSVEKGHNLTLFSRVKPVDEILERYTRFDIHPELIILGEDGNRQSLRIYNTSSEDYRYHFMDLYRYT